MDQRTKERRHCKPKTEKPPPAPPYKPTTSYIRTSDIFQFSCSLKFLSIDLSKCPDTGPTDYCPRVYEGNKAEFKFIVLSGGCVILSEAPSQVSNKLKNYQWYLVATGREENNSKPLDTANALGTRITLKSSPNYITECPTGEDASFLGLFNTEDEDSPKTMFFKQIYRNVHTNQYASFDGYHSKLVSSDYSKVFKEPCDHKDLSNGCWMQIKDISNFPPETDDIVVEHKFIGDLHLSLLSGELGFIKSNQITDNVILNTKFETNPDDTNSILVAFDPEDPESSTNNPINRELDGSCENGKWVVEKCQEPELFSFKYDCEGQNNHLYYSISYKILEVTSAAIPLSNNMCFKFYSRRTNK